MHPAKKERRQNQRKRQIVAAATSVVAEEGPEALTMAALAHSLDLTPGALYRYFPSKEHILAAVELAAIDEISEVFDGVARALKELRPIERLVGLIDAYRLMEEERAPQFRLLSRFLGSDVLLPDELAASVLSPSLQVFAILAREFSLATAAGELEPGDDLERAMVLWSAIHGMLERRKLARLTPATIDIQRLVQATTMALLAGWGASADDLDTVYRRRLTRFRSRYAETIGSTP